MLNPLSIVDQVARNMSHSDHPDTDLQDATLGGIACRAVAWVAVARYEAEARNQKREAPAGRRAWRGMALIEGTGMSSVGAWLNRAVPYNGMLQAGGELIPIAAEVYITDTRTEVRRGTESAPVSSVVRVEFSGAHSI